MAPSRSVKDTARPPGRPRSAASRGLAALRLASGAVVAGLLALATVLGVAALVAGDKPGPGAGTIAGHSAVALAALALQLYADRRHGVPAVLAALLVFPLAAGTLWLWWWS